MKKRYLGRATFTNGKTLPFADSNDYATVKAVALNRLKEAEVVSCEIITYHWMFSLTENRREKRFHKIEYLYKPRPGWRNE